MILRLQKRKPSGGWDPSPLFAIFLGAIALALFVAATVSLVEIGSGYWKTRTDVRVSVKIESLKIATHTGRTPMTSTRASYSYEWEGHRFVGDRVSLFVVGHELKSLLTKAFESGESVEAWIDPLDPSYSVIDREWEWGEFIAIIALQVFFGLAASYCFRTAVFGPKPPKRKRHFGKPLLRLP